MNAALLGHLLGAFLVPLFFAAVTLIVCWIIPPLRRNPSTSYGIAIGLAVGLVVLSMLGNRQVDPFSILGLAACIAVLLWQRKRAIRKQQAVQLSSGGA